MDQLPYIEMDCQHEFEPQTLFSIASDDTVLCVLSDDGLEPMQALVFVVVDLIDLKGLKF